MITLCQTCAVEHACDDTGCQCSKVRSGTFTNGYPEKCDHYKPTREKQLDAALHEICEALDGVTHNGGLRVQLALGNACELIQRKKRP